VKHGFSVVLQKARKVWEPAREDRKKEKERKE